MSRTGTSGATSRLRELIVAAGLSPRCAKIVTRTKVPGREYCPAQLRPDVRGEHQLAVDFRAVRWWRRSDWRCASSALARRRSGRGSAASRGGRAKSRTADRGRRQLTRSCRELPALLMPAAVPTSQAADRSLRSSVSPRPHTTAKPKWQLHRCKTQSRSGRGRAKLFCGVAAVGSGAGHFRGWSGKP